MAAAIPAIAMAGVGLIASKLSQPKQQALPNPIAAPPIPDAAAQARASAEAAQRAAGFQRLRANNATQNGTILTGPSGLPSPAPIQRKTLLG